MRLFASLSDSQRARRRVAHSPLNVTLVKMVCAAEERLSVLCVAGDVFMKIFNIRIVIFFLLLVQFLEMKFAEEKPLQDWWRCSYCETLAKTLTRMTRSREQCANFHLAPS